MVKAFRRRHSDIFAAIYNTTVIYNDALDNPTKYGFKDAISSCQTKECIWNDDVHPTFELHRLLAADLVTYLGSF